MSDTKTFLITGVSTGLGRALARAASAAGHRVVGTVRTPADARAFEALAGDAHARILDVTDHDAVDTVVNETERDLGPVDVLVANAGYGHDGLFEESSMDDLRRQFEVNVYGTVAVIKAVLPHMRKRRTGHILAVTSMGGLITMPGLSFYHGSKFAVEGILETLGKEVADFGIHVTAVEPGSFRKKDLGSRRVGGRQVHDRFEAVLVTARIAVDGDPHRPVPGQLGVVQRPYRYRPRRPPPGDPQSRPVRRAMVPPPISATSGALFTDLPFDMTG